MKYKIYIEYHYNAVLEWIEGESKYYLRLPLDSPDLQIADMINDLYTEFGIEVRRVSRHISLGESVIMLTSQNEGYYFILKAIAKALCEFYDTAVLTAEIGDDEDLN